VVLVVAACYLSQCGQPTRPTKTKSTKSKQRNDNDDRYLINIRNYWNLVTLDPNSPDIYQGRVG